jgi:membrane-bound lytic murein transglycosylase B
MKAIALAAAFLLLAAQEAPRPPDDSPMVKAAKAAGGKRKPTRKVITNADVKKSTGKLVPLPPAKDAKPEPAVVDTVGPLAKQDEQRRGLAAAARRVDDAEKKAAELEAELRRIEQAYYAESDLSRRDTEWVTRFDQTKRQLDGAKRELSDARDALEKCCQ